MSRSELFRRAGKLALGTAVLAVGAALPPLHAEADRGDIPPTPRPETRDPFVQMIDTTTLSIDPDLPDDPERKLLKIVGLSTNPYQAEFAELNPNNPYDRLDRLYVELCRGLQPRRAEIKAIPDRLLSDEEFIASPMAIRANAGEIPNMLSVEEFTKKIGDHPDLSIWMWTHDKDGKPKLTTMKAKNGMGVSIIKDPPKVGFNQDGIGNYVAGYTHEIIDHRLHLGLYRQDFKPDSGGGDPENGIYTPSFNADIEISNLLRLAVEDLILYGGNKQMHDGLGVKYLKKTNSLPSASLFSEVAELTLGALRTYEAFGYTAYDSAPVLHVQSPDIDPANRYR